MVIASLVLACIAAVALATLPLVTQENSLGEKSSTTLIDQEGTGVVVVLAIPILLIGGVLLIDKTRYQSAGRILGAFILVILSFVTVTSIGLFFIPAAGAMVLAALART